MKYETALTHNNQTTELLSFFYNLINLSGNYIM